MVLSRITAPSRRVAMLSVHTSPLAPLGSGSAGGMNVYIRELSRQLAAVGYTVDIFTRRTKEDSPEITNFGRNARVIEIQAGPAAECEKDDIFDHLPEFVCSVRRFADANEIDYDIVHSHYWLSGWAGWLLKKWWNIPMIHMFHTLGLIKNSVAEEPDQLESDRRIEVEKQLVKVADRLVSASPTDMEDLVSLYGAEQDKISVIPCGVDLGLFGPVDKSLARRITGLESDQLVLFVGRIEPLKGLPTLIEAMAQVSMEEQPRLVVVGGATYDGECANGNDNCAMEKLKSLADKAGIPDQALFLGPQPQRELRYFYSAADICVVPSRYESFGLVALEAMACGTPVIASEVGGLKSTVRDGETGYLVREDDPSQLATRITMLLRDEQLRQRLGWKAAEAATQYSWPIVAGQMMRLYEDTMRVSSNFALRSDSTDSFTCWGNQ